METKTCPSCSEDVPTAAARCKHCFHDFSAAPPKRPNPLLPLLLLIAACGIVGGGVYWWVSERATECKVDVDGEREAITWVCVYKNGPRADLVLPFSDIGKVSYAAGGQGEDTFVVSVCEKSGDCHVVENSRKPLDGTAARIARLVGVEVDKKQAETGGLGKGMLTP